MSMRYEAHEFLAAPARPSAQLWRLGFGIALIVACFVALTFTYFNILAVIVTDAEWPRFSAEIDAGSTPRGMLALLGAFGMLLLALTLVLNQLHHRPLRSLIGPPAQALRDFLGTGIALTALGTLLWLLPEPGPMAPQPGLPLLRWLALLPLAIPLVLLQVGTEELAFRGYLQSQLAARFAHPLVWMGLPAVIFGALHYDPATSGANAPVLALSAFLFGLVAADLTARSGTLGPAIALHFANNLAALLFTAPQNYGFGLALHLYPFATDDTAALATWLPYDTLMLLCAWLCARLAIRR